MTLSYVYTKSQSHGGAGRREEQTRRQIIPEHVQGRGWGLTGLAQLPEEAALLAIQLELGDPCYSQAEIQIPRTRPDTRQEQLCSCPVHGIWPHLLPVLLL